MLLKINLGSLLKSVFLICLVLVGFVVCAQGAETEEKKSVLEWVQANWAVIALIVSETAALLPTKISGIVQAVVTGISAIFKKK